MLSKNWLLSLLWLTGTFLTAQTNAAITTVPDGLRPGDQYRLVFVTSERTAATSTDISYYNNFVDVLGDNVIESHWKIIGSTAAIDAKNNTGTNPLAEQGVPIFRLDNVLVADDYADFWDGDLYASIDVTNDGNSLFRGNDGDLVWTGANFEGGTIMQDLLGDATQCNPDSAAESPSWESNWTDPLPWHILLDSESGRGRLTAPFAVI